ncbi:cytosine-specific methyltransferase [Mycoplasmopsis citelli]|uniref:Cytosine-specific methyltransferase n=1 Tax=Mycoplasmopsis citelli TaxID=171281 RepID=A0A449B348_9BACT|nr:DNA cytosine methyltransferase [Mycoplasmopsis citelli]VEU74985.1 cytosine-specific methyltransferase [Mycoplasmopsis citelli]
MNKLKCGSFFAGVGGIDLGFKQVCDTVYASEYNPKPVETFESNFNLKVDIRDIREVKASEIPDFDILLAGFPCQAFSIAGYRQGFDDQKGRGNLFFEIERIILEKKPSVVFLENVKNLVSHDKGNTFKIILQKLHDAGYFVKHQVLNTMTHGNTPQNRERIYIVGFLDKNHYEKFEFPQKIELKTQISDIVGFENKVDNKYYYTKDNFKHFDVLSEQVNNSKNIYQWRRRYVRENKSNVCPTLTANCGTGGHNVPIIYTKHGIRKLTPQECFKFQGFDKDFVLPNQANSHLYKQAGNSVSVTVIKRIAKQILKNLIL